MAWRLPDPHALIGRDYKASCCPFRLRPIALFPHWRICCASNILLNTPQCSLRLSEPPHLLSGAACLSEIFPAESESEANPCGAKEYLGCFPGLAPLTATAPNVYVVALAYALPLSLRPTFRPSGLSRAHVLPLNRLV